MDLKSGNRSSPPQYSEDIPGGREVNPIIERVLARPSRRTASSPGLPCEILDASFLHPSALLSASISGRLDRVVLLGYFPNLTS